MSKRAAGGVGRVAADVLAVLDQIAPLGRAEEWDNVGLLAGSPEWPVCHALLAIDLTDAVANEALRKRVDALVLYHPPIFKGIKSVTPDAATPTTRLADLIRAGVSIFAVHTALDVADGGTNDVLLDAFAPVERYPLEPVIDAGQQYKLVVFVPPTEVGALREALSAAGAGVIGHYHECSYELRGRGTFCGDETTNPTVGRKQRLEHVEETRLEMVVPHGRLGGVVRALYAEHSYEEPAFDLYPLQSLAGRGLVGLGRVGRLARPATGRALLRNLDGVVDLSCATVVGDLRRRFTSVTAAAGAFGVRRFRDADSLVLTGEFKHHDALELLKRNVTAVCIGHAASERPALGRLRDQLRRRLRGLRVELARSDCGPLSALPRRT